MILMHSTSFKMFDTGREMKRSISFNAALSIVIILVTGSNQNHVDWYTAQEQCNTNYASHLIPQRYIVDQNLTHDIVKNIGINASAWVDGNMQEFGCSPEICLRMKSILEQNDRKLPYICGTSRGFDINSSEVTYTMAQKVCDSAKLKLKVCHPQDLYKVLPGKRAGKSEASVAFWVPNVEFCDNQDIGCAHVLSRDNNTLQTMYGNCSIPKAGVCINKTYISNYKLSFVLEMTVKRLPSNTLEDEEKAEFGSQTLITNKWETPSTSGTDVHLQTESVNSNYSDLKNYLPYVISGLSLILVLVSIAITTVVWKRLSSSKMEGSRTCVPRDSNPSTSTSRGKKKDKKKVYETLHLVSQGNSTNATAPSSEEENPYSVICQE